MRPLNSAARGSSGVGIIRPSRPTLLAHKQVCFRNHGSRGAYTPAAIPKHAQPLCGASWQRSSAGASTSGHGSGILSCGSQQGRRQTVRQQSAAAAAAGSQQEGDAGTAQAEWQGADDDIVLDGDEEMTEEQALEMQAALEALTYDYVEYCRERFEIEDLVEIGLGVNDLPAVYLHHPNGTELEVYLHGANITSWRKRDGTEILFLRPGNTFDGVSPIQGGVPVIFPQYGRGLLPINGFLRHAHWSVAETGCSDPRIAEDPAPSVALWTESDDDTLAIWPHKFEAMYSISLMETDDLPDPRPPEHVTEEESDAQAAQSKRAVREGRFMSRESGKDEEIVFEAAPQDTEPTQLRCVLEILNTDEQPFTFTTALQTHFAVKQLGPWPDNSRFVKVLGLGGKWIMDYTKDAMHPRLRHQQADYVFFGEEPVDRMYVDTDKTDVKLCPGDRTHHEIINRRGFKDTGALNPHERVPDAWRHFVSVPSARVARPITLQPGESWSGEMVIRSYDTMWEQPMFEMEMDGDEDFQPLDTEPMPPSSSIPQPRPAFPDSYA